MIPLATTTVTWARPVIDEPDEPASSSDVIASGVRAHIGDPSGRERRIGGSERTVTKKVDCDPVAGVDATCTLTDEQTGVVYDVVWVDQRQGLGLDHTVAGLSVTKGRAA